MLKLLKCLMEWGGRIKCEYAWVCIYIFAQTFEKEMRHGERERQRGGGVRQRVGRERIN